MTDFTPDSIDRLFLDNSKKINVTVNASNEVTLTFGSQASKEVIEQVQRFVDSGHYKWSMSPLGSPRNQGAILSIYSPKLNAVLKPLMVAQALTDKLRELEYEVTMYTTPTKEVKGKPAEPKNLEK